MEAFVQKQPTAVNHETGDDVVPKDPEMYLRKKHLPKFLTGHCLLFCSCITSALLRCRVRMRDLKQITVLEQSWAA